MKTQTIKTQCSVLQIDSGWPWSTPNWGLLGPSLTKTGDETKSQDENTTRCEGGGGEKEEAKPDRSFTPQFWIWLIYAFTIAAAHILFIDEII